MEEEFEDSVVIDASFMLGYLLPDEQLEKVQGVFERYKKGDLRLISTQLFPFEVINGLYAAVLSKRLEPGLAREIVKNFLELPITIEEVDYTLVFEIAIRYKISVYDSSYFSLARQKHVPFFTLDKKLGRIK